MNPAAATPVNRLTEAQAVDELARIMDAAPDESDQLARIHWGQANSARAQQLEQHIIHCQRLAARGETTEPEPATKAPNPATPDPLPEEVISQDAPPHHLQPEPAPAPGPAKEKKHAMTPKEKVESLVRQYLVALDKAKAAPGDQKLRNAVNVVKGHIKARCASFKLTLPDLEPLPALPDPSPLRRLLHKDAPVRPTPTQAHVMPPALQGRAKRELDPLPSRASLVAEEHAERSQTIQMIVDVCELPKAGPGPYREPTAEQILAALPSGTMSAAQVHAEMCELPAAPDARFRRTNPAPEPAPIAADLARDIARAFWPLCSTLDGMTDRAALRPALDQIYARLQIAYALVDEGDVAQVS